MFLPKSGRVIIVDDQINEAMPLINILSQKDVPTLYYSGKVDEMPSEPLTGVRLVFCDLKFNASTDSKSVISNIKMILNKLIGEQNGPYILIVWSTHQDDYIGELRSELEDINKIPEFILCLDKFDYFRTYDPVSETQENLLNDLENFNLDAEDYKNIKNIVEKYFSSLQQISLIPNDDVIDEITKKLEAELKKAGLFHLFVIWENIMGESALQTVNTLYNEVSYICEKKRFRAMFFYLSQHRLEKRMDKSEQIQKFWAAIDALNELFPYFYTENSKTIDNKPFDEELIDHIDEVKNISRPRFNRWKMISNAPEDHKPGNVFIDEQMHFSCCGLIPPKKITDEKPYSYWEEQILDTKGIIYVLVDISSECDIAQDKIYKSRVIPGIIMPSAHYEQLKRDKTIKQPDSVFVTSDIELNDEVFKIILDLNQLFSMDIEELYKQYVLFFTFTDSFTVHIKQETARCISKHGIGVF